VDACELKDRGTISLIVLAAGRSTRFGSNKLLYKLNDETMIERVVKNCTESKADEVVVVVGFEADKIRQVLKGLCCRIVLNSTFETGQSSSVVIGVKSVKDHAKAVMILPGDMAFVEVQHINKVIEEYNSTGAALVVASHMGRMGHPILVDAALLDEVVKISEETFGLKEIVKKYRDQIKFVETGSREVLVDVDVRDDLVAAE
jgi:molybdenum cofactor cytidylyltransferase